MPARGRPRKRSRARGAQVIARDENITLAPLSITKPHNLLPSYLQTIQRDLPEVFQSIESMHAHVLANYSPNHLPARYKKEAIASCEKIAYPNTLFDEPLGMQIVLMSHGYLQLYPFLRVVVLHNATVYLSAEENGEATETNTECESMVTDLLWMLYVDKSRIAAKWNGIVAEILGHPIFPSADRARSPDRRMENASKERDDAHSAHLHANSSESAEALQMLCKKYKKRIAERMPSDVKGNNVDECTTSTEAVCSNGNETDLTQTSAAIQRLHTLATFLHGLPAKRINVYKELIQYGKRHGPMLVIAPSQIHNAGFGLYLCGRLPENARISMYAGLFTSKDRIKLGENSGYLLHYRKGINIDGGEMRTLASMVNDYRDKSVEKKGKANSRFACSGLSHSIRTKRAVENEEILIFYGLSYRIKAVNNVVSQLKEQALRDGGPIPIHPASGILEALRM